MRPASAFALGLLHGPAELLPVSSSAHAALAAQHVAPARRKELEVALHAGTLAALGLPRPSRWLALATAPPALAGLIFERPIQARLGTPRGIAAGLVLGGIAMALTDALAADPRPRPRVPGTRAREAEGLPPGRALALGVAQAAALVPGVSRHGAALTALRGMGIGRRDAQLLSREASKPVLLGATALKGARVARHRQGTGTLAAAAAGSAIGTAAARRALDRRALDAPLWPFALYRAALAASVWRHG
jgi:undecaprenyl-diphosphatase